MTGRERNSSGTADANQIFGPVRLLTSCTLPAKTTRICCAGTGPADHVPPPLCLPGDLTKFGRGDASSPAPATTLAQPQQNQTQTHHTTQQTFLNPALPPGYSYTSLPYYTGVPGLPSTFQYGPAVFPVSASLGLGGEPEPPSCSPLLPQLILHLSAFPRSPLLLPSSTASTLA